MEEITNDQSSDLPINPIETNIQYGTFAPRMGALLLDGLIMAPISILCLMDMIMWKNSLLLLIGYLLTIIYKPFCEYKWSATPGKMALNCKVVNDGFEKADLNAILLRNIFYITKNILFMIFLLVILSQPEYQDVNTLKEYNAYLFKFPSYWIFSIIFIIIDIIEFALLVSDNQSRSLMIESGRPW